MNSEVECCYFQSWLCMIPQAVTAASRLSSSKQPDFPYQQN